MIPAPPAIVSQFSIALTLPAAFSLVFFALLLTYVIYGLILIYHWFTYGNTYKMATTALIVYLSGGLFCIVLMLPAIL